LSEKRRDKKEKERDIQRGYKKPQWVENQKAIHAKIKGISLG